MKTKKEIHKKAQIEISFNWIFVLIAGAAILVFFIMVTKHEKESSTEQTTRAVSGRLESLLSAVQQNPGAVQTQSNLNVEMEFHCEQDGHTYSLKDSTARAELESQIIFSPETVGNSNTIIWTKIYNSPYPVVQILYFSDEKTKYIFEDTQTVKEYYFKMPEQFQRNLSSLDTIKKMEDQGFRQYIIIASSADAPGIQLTQSMKKKSVILGVSPSAKSVSFRNANEASSTTTYYVNDETLFGAIISGNYALYGCTMEKLMASSRIVGEINLERTKMLAETENSKCKLFFSSGIPQNYVSEIIANSKYKQEEDYKELEDAITSLENTNRNMARANCPTLY